MRAETAAAAEPAKFSKVALTMLVGMLVGLATSLVMLLIFSFIMTIKDIPQGIVPTLSAAAVAIGSFAGGMSGAKLHKKAGFAIGIVVGICMYLLLMLTGLAMNGEGFGASSAVKLVISFASGGIGGIIGVNTRKSRRF